MEWLTRGTYVTLQPRLRPTDPSAGARFLQSLVTHVDGPRGSTISKLFYWSLRRHQDENQTAPVPSGGVAERAVRGAPSARAKRAQGGEQIKVSGRLITQRILSEVSPQKQSI